MMILGRNPTMTLEEWAALDWNRTASEIAAQVGVSESRVYHYARELGKTVVNARPSIEPGTIITYKTVDWHGVDWANKKNVPIALETGATRERVRQMRKRLAPETIEASRSRKGIGGAKKGGKANAG